VTETMPSAEDAGSEERPDDHPTLDQLQGATAGFVTRLLAYLLDALILTGIIAIGSWAMLQVDALFEDMGANLRISVSTAWGLLTPVIISAYYVIFWALTGKTIGKAFLGVKVVRTDGRPPKIGQSLLRLVGYALSTLAFFAGYLWIIIDDNRKGWHDHIARTWVVYDWEKRRKGEIYRAMTEDG